MPRTMYDDFHDSYTDLVGGPLANAEDSGSTLAPWEDDAVLCTAASGNASFGSGDDGSFNHGNIESCIEWNSKRGYKRYLQIKVGEEVKAYVDTGSDFGTGSVRVRYDALSSTARIHILGAKAMDGSAYDSGQLNSGSFMLCWSSLTGA